MTVTVAPDKIYFGICLLLLVLQVYQYYMIRKLRYELESVWTQLGIMVAAVSSKLLDLDKKVDKNEKNNKD
jgi:hypothetical protein